MAVTHGCDADQRCSLQRVAAFFVAFLHGSSFPPGIDEPISVSAVNLFEMTLATAAMCSPKPDDKSPAVVHELLIAMLVNRKGTSKSSISLRK